MSRKKVGITNDLVYNHRHTTSGEKETYMNLSQKIKQLREEKGFSLGKLAETAEVSKAICPSLK